MMQKVMSKIFSIMWSRCLVDDFTGKKCKIVRMKGWRTALIDTPSGSRMTVSPLFWWEND